MEKGREFQKNIYFCLIDYAKAFACVDHNKLRKIPEEMGIPDHLICIQVSQEADQVVWYSHLFQNFPQNIILFIYYFIYGVLFYSFYFIIYSTEYSNEYSGLICFSVKWFDLLTVQGTVKSFPQHHSLKASILRCQPLYSPTLTSIHDYWKNHNFDHMDLSQQSDVSAF